jgi:hypothetical protein
MNSSEPRKKANRQNALKSTGPRSMAGKLASSANATQHGILSRHLILPGESRAEFDALLQQLMAEQQPVGTLEQALVERMAVALWRQRRLVAAETAQAELRQGEWTLAQLVRVKQITGVKDEDWINALAREPLLDVDDLQAEVAECQAWLDEVSDAPTYDLVDLEQRFPRLWSSLAADLEVDTPEQAATVLDEEADDLARRVQSLLLNNRELVKIVTAFRQLRQSALLPQQADVLARYQSSLDNDMYKAMRALREAQRHRLEQAALTAKPVPPSQP